MKVEDAELLSGLRSLASPDGSIPNLDIRTFASLMGTSPGTVQRAFVRFHAARILQAKRQGLRYVYTLTEGESDMSKMSYQERGRVGGVARWAGKSDEERREFMRTIGRKGGRKPSAYRVGSLTVAGEANAVAAIVDELVAAAGPEPEQPMAQLAPARKDEAGALIEAARQYQQAMASIKDHLKALEDLGMIVSITEGPTQNLTLEAVSLVLPEIDLLRNQVAMWQTRYQTLHDQTRDYATLKARVESQSDQIKRLASRPNGTAAHA